MKRVSSDAWRISRTQVCSLPEASEGHGESGRAKAILSLDYFVTAKLDAMDKSVILVVRDGYRGSDLAEERNNGATGVTTNDGDSKLGGGLAGDLRDEGLGTDNIKGGDTEEALGVKDALGLEDLSRDRDGRVDRVGDDKDESVGGNLGSNLNQSLDDSSVDVEQVVPGHAGLAYRSIG